MAETERFRCWWLAWAYGLVSDTEFGNFMVREARWERKRSHLR